MNKRISRLVVGVVMAALASATASAAPAPNSPTGMSPANALVMPFDVSATKLQTRLFVQNMAGEGSRLATTTRWYFWGEDGDHLADVIVCMHHLDAVEIDPRELRGIDEHSEPVGPTVNLSGIRGFVVVTAYQPSPACGAPPRFGGRPIDNALMGSFAIKEGRANRAFSGPAAGFGLDRRSGRTTLPTTSLHTRVHVPVRVTKKSDFSRVVLIPLAEGRGHDEAEGVLGPISEKTFATIRHLDRFGESATTAALEIEGAFFGTATPGATDSLAPSGPGMLSVQSTQDGIAISVDSLPFLIDVPVYVLAFHGEHADHVATTRMGAQVD